MLPANVTHDTWTNTYTLHLGKPAPFDGILAEGIVGFPSKEVAEQVWTTWQAMCDTLGVTYRSKAGFHILQAIESKFFVGNNRATS